MLAPCSLYAIGIPIAGALKLGLEEYRAYAIDFMVTSCLLIGCFESFLFDDFIGSYTNLGYDYPLLKVEIDQLIYLKAYIIGFTMMLNVDYGAHIFFI